MKIWKENLTCIKMIVNKNKKNKKINLKSINKRQKS